MLTAIETFDHAGCKVQIFPDDSGSQECPLEMMADNDVRFVTFEKRSTLSDYHDFGSPSDVIPWAKKNRYAVFELYKYEHGMVRYAVSVRGNPFYGKLPQGHAEFDSGQVGYVLVKRGTYRGLSKQYDAAESWADSVSRWCNGEYYGYMVKHDDDDVDSCWGFDDFDYCKEQAKEAAEAHQKTGAMS